MKRRVVVTGVGLVTPLGTGVAKSWENICAGKSGVALITRFDTSDFQVRIAAEVKDFNVEDFLDKKTVNRYAEKIQEAEIIPGSSLAQALPVLAGLLDVNRKNARTHVAFGTMIRNR